MTVAAQNLQAGSCGAVVLLQSQTETYEAFQAAGRAARAGGMRLSFIREKEKARGDYSDSGAAARPSRYGHGRNVATGFSCIPAKRKRIALAAVARRVESAAQELGRSQHREAARAGRRERRSAAGSGHRQRDLHGEASPAAGG